MRTLRSDLRRRGRLIKPGSIPGKAMEGRERAGSERVKKRGSEPPWEFQVYCQQRRVWPGSEPPRSRAAGERQGTAGGNAAGSQGGRGGRGDGRAEAGGAPR